MATTIAAPPSEVWPWLVQMGCDHAGFYSWDRLDNGGRPSADRLHAEWQSLAVGDRVSCVPDASMWFEVAMLDPEHVLVLRTSARLPGGERFDPAAGMPPASIDSTWAFLLTPTPDGGTRLVVRTNARGRPQTVFEVFNRLVAEPAHRVMQAKQLRELRRRAEGAHPRIGVG
jgi:hypothetical protein